MPELVVLKGFYCLPFGFHSEATCECNINTGEGISFTLKLEVYMSAPCLYSHCCGSFPFSFQPSTWKIILRHRFLRRPRPQILAVRGRTEGVMCVNPASCLSIKPCLALSKDVRTVDSEHSSFPLHGALWFFLLLKSSEERLALGSEVCFHCATFP